MSILFPSIGPRDSSSSSYSIFTDNSCAVSTNDDDVNVNGNDDNIDDDDIDFDLLNVLITYSTI